MRQEEKDIRIREYWQQRTLGDSPVKSAYTRKIADLLSAAGGKVLDIGCGRGRWMQVLPASDAVGVDLIFENCKVTHWRTRYDIVCADARTLPFRGQCFDYVYSIQVLGSFPRFSLAVREAFRVGKSGSGVLLTFLNKTSPYSIVSFLRRRSGRLPYVRRFTPKEVKVICSRNLQYGRIVVTGIPLPPKLQSIFQALDSILGNEIVVTGIRTR